MAPSHAQYGHSQPGPAPSAFTPAPQHAQSQPDAGALQHVQHNPNAVLVSHKQKGNPVLKHIANVRKEFSDIVPDYMIGANSCALFLSLRYHLLKPDYIHFRIRELQRSFTLRILLCHVDVDDVVEPLQQVTKAAIANNMTLICVWSDLECARYLETFKAYESKPADLIQGRADEDYLSRLNAAITTVRGVNRTDVLTLGATFHTAAGIMQASMDELSTCPGIGPTKIRRLFEAFHEPFRKSLNASEALPEAAPDAQGQMDARAADTITGLNPDLVVLDSDEELDEPDLA